MRILRAYLRREFLKFFSLILVSFVGLYLIVEFFERVDDFVEHHATWVAVAQYFAYKLPFIVFQVVPFAVLLATILTFSILSKNNEITAMKASGVALIAIASPIMVASLLISGVTFAANEYFLPHTNRKHRQIFEITVRKRHLSGLVRSKNIWYQSADNIIWNIHHFDKASGKLNGIALYRLNSANRLFQRIDADSARWDGELWRFENVYIRDFHSDGSFRTEYFPTKSFPFSEQPGDFGEIQKDPNEMSYKEIRRLVKEIRASGYDDTHYAVEMNSKLATPLTAFIMALFGVPFSLRTGRRGGLFFGIVLSIAVGFSYWVLTSVTLALGHAGHLPPALSAWSPNLLFSSSGLYLLLSVQQ
ncbi:MAG: LPS export ABC transporter permease LptG [Nitrospinae bacterium]|nr:LPS export ABC transporter permease LptG [Nitrospinota bacterium]